MKNLKSLRESRNLSQRKLGELLSISGRRISTYESGQIEPDLQTLIQFADFFNVTIDNLVGYERDSFKKPCGDSLELNKFGARVRQYRTQKGLSGKELAQMVGITPQYLLVIETGGKIPKLETCIKILNALEASADAAFMDSLIEGYPNRARYIEFKISLLNPENQCLALDMLETLVDRLQTRQADGNEEN